MKKRILVADDEAWTRDLVRMVLCNLGYEVSLANDGLEAFEMLGSDRPDLLVTDVNMPRMDGFSLVRNMRARTELALTPVIFLTVRDSREDQVRGFRLGADDYLPKPFYPEELGRRVQGVVNRSERLLYNIEREIRSAGDGSGKTIEASLEYLGLGGLLTLLTRERSSGSLELSDGGRRGRLGLRDGRIVSAQVFGDQPVDGVETIFDLLGWQGGRFRFEAEAGPLEDNIRAPLSSLLMEAARRFDMSGFPS